MSVDFVPAPVRERLAPSKFRGSGLLPAGPFAPELPPAGVECLRNHIRGGRTMTQSATEAQNKDVVKRYWNGK